MSTGTLTLAEVIGNAAGLVEKYGLCRHNYEDDVTGMVDPSGAVAYAVGLPPGVWTDPHWTVLETEAYQSGHAALYLLVAGLERWEMPHIGEWEGEDLANYIAWWISDEDPTDEQVIQWMRDVAAVLSFPAENGARA
ncbi:hypothetical protein HS041_12030 [Planomonospora sp. ID67723]|uniref:DUF6197 family protein n=1 Tax=Planomonospora sp. ID67723 TaxID=2738134 RepID=UPI0018C3E351|nr:hypothetical protein [Planomonospora sp. ID67723]MBG0828496.1 hypothetical protein [Planomonospora sp. ID67723]